MDRDNVLRTEQTAQGGSDGRNWRVLRIWSDIMTVLEVMQKQNSLYLLLALWHSSFPPLPGLDPWIFFRTVNLEFKPRILYTCKEKHKIWAGVMINLKNLRSFITSCSHLKIYVSSQESNEMQHSEVKWSFLMCQDSHVDFFSVLPVGSNPKETWCNPVISTQWKVGKVAAFSEKQKGYKVTSLQMFYDVHDCLLSSGKRNRRMKGSQSRGFFP